MDQRSEAIQKKLEWPVLAASVLVIPAVLIEVNDYASPWPMVGYLISIVVWLVFLFEFCAMMVVVPDRREWISTHKLETVLLVVSFPVLPTGLGALRLVRLIQIARLSRLAKIARFSFSMKGLPYVGLLTLLLVLAAGSAFSAIEKGQGLDALDGMWWSLSTVTTVGYGDVAPRTQGGRLVALFVMMLGIGFVAVLTASIAQYFVKHELDERAAADPTSERAEILAEVGLVNQRLDAIERALCTAEETPPPPAVDTTE